LQAQRARKILTPRRHPRGTQPLDLGVKPQQRFGCRINRQFLIHGKQRISPGILDRGIRLQQQRFDTAANGLLKPQGYT
jgi:hypothetical protein